MSRCLYLFMLVISLSSISWGIPLLDGDCDKAPDQLYIKDSVVRQSNDDQKALLDKIVQMGRQIIDLKFVNLKDKPIQINYINTKGDFFGSGLKIKCVRLGKNLKRRIYILNVNPEVLTDWPGDREVYAILLHEFSHLNDYSYLTDQRVTQLGFYYQFSIPFISKDVISEYERATDKVALIKGAGEDLNSYRRWLFEKIKNYPKIREGKIRDYLGFDEVSAFIADPSSFETVEGYKVFQVEDSNLESNEYSQKINNSKLIKQLTLF